MRTIVAILVLLGLLTIPLVAQAPVFVPGDSIGFDYLDTDVATYQVNRFEAQYDSGAWVAVGMVVYASANGVTTYKFSPTQANGNHSVVVHACNAGGCGQPSLPFAFAILSAPASAPTNLRKISG